MDTTPPTIVVTVNPDSGITNETEFTFNPAGSSDNLAPVEDLRIRYDYENDGVWDTEFGKLEVEKKIYEVGGGDKVLKVQIQDGAGCQTDTIQNFFVNTRPQASFFIALDEVNYKKFHFNASESSDYEDGKLLEYRWDFDNDGRWDTEWLMQDKVSFEYPDDNGCSAKLIVRDDYLLTEESVKQVINPKSTMTDIDGNVYKTVKIGNQWWMAENLRVTHYKNGDIIPNVTDDSEWMSQTTGAYCAYENINENIETYGLLYNWYTVNDPRKVAPEGWHVPSDYDWKQLEIYLGMSQSSLDSIFWRGTNEGSKLKATGAIWKNSTDATNESGFTALPSGSRDASHGIFSGIGYAGNWWTSSLGSYSYSAWSRILSYDKTGVYRSGANKEIGRSIRCVRY